jgi:hypothetical protein
MKNIRFFALLRMTILFGCISIYGCKEKNDNYRIKIDKVAEQRYKDSLMKNIMQNAVFGDTSNLYSAPVIVTKATLVKQEYSNYKDVSLTYKNISGKKIEAIKFKWYGVDAFGEAADMGSTFEGIGGGFDDDGLRAGAIKTGQWSVMSSRGKKITKACPYEVVFADGTKWKVSHD